MENRKRTRKSKRITDVKAAAANDNTRQEVVVTSDLATAAPVTLDIILSSRNPSLPRKPPWRNC
jgi:hypothetical protein